MATQWNPEAPEFHPTNYHHQRTTQLHYHPPISIQAPNPKPSYFHYPATPYFWYAKTCFPANEANGVPRFHNLLVPAVAEPSPPNGQTHSVHETLVKVEDGGTSCKICPERAGNGSRFSGKREYEYGGPKLLHGKQEWRARYNGSGRSTEKQKRFGWYSSCGANWKQSRPAAPLEPDGQHTTLMIRNIPNKYTRELLMEFLDNHCMVENQKAKSQSTAFPDETIVSAFDFLYLPMDFQGVYMMLHRRGANKGYAFVNFTHPRAAWKFHLATHNHSWDLFQSSKIREIASARIQGKEELVKHFQKSSFECDSDMYLPICFSPPRDGSGGNVTQRLVGRRVVREDMNCC